jgi:hypothetical protein
MISPNPPNQPSYSPAGKTLVGSVIIQAPNPRESKIPQLIKTSEIKIDGQLVGFQKVLTSNNDVKEVFFKLCKAIADNKTSDINQLKKELENQSPSFRDFINKLNKKVVQDLCLYDLTLKPQSWELISEKTLTFLLRYNHGKLNNTFTPLLSKTDYRDFSDSLEKDLKTHVPFISGLRQSINDDKKFIDLVIGENSYLVPSNSGEIFDLIRAQTTDGPNYVASQVINFLTSNSGGDITSSPTIDILDTTNYHQKAKDYLIEFLSRDKTIIQKDLKTEDRIERDGNCSQSVTIYSPGLEQLLTSVNQELKGLSKNKTIGKFHDFLLETIKRYKLLQPDVPASKNSINQANREYEKMNSLFEKSYKRIEETLESLRKILDGESLVRNGSWIKFGTLLKKGKEAIDDARVSSPLGLQGIGFEKDYLKDESQKLIGIDDVALKIVKLAFEKFEGKSSDLTENDFIMRTTANKSIKDPNKDFPHLLYKAFKDVFDIKADKQTLFDQYLDATNLQINKTSRINQYVLMALMTIGGAVGGGYYSHIPEKPVVYKISSDSATKEPYQTLINETLKLLPNELTINANDKIYSLKRDDFWIYEILGIPEKAQKQQFTGLINKIVSEHPKLTNKKSELYQLIIDQIKSLNSKAKYPILPLIINLPEPDKGTVLIVLTSSNFFQTAIEEHKKASREPKNDEKTYLSLAFLLESFPGNLQYQLDPSKTPTTRVDITNPNLPRIKEILENLPNKE